MSEIALPSAAELDQSWQLATRLCKTEFVPAALRGKPEAVLACVLAGRELGIGPMQALQSIHMIQGRPEPSADLKVALVRRAGHRIRTVERTAERACVEGVRADDPDAPHQVTFTLDDAKRARLLDKDNWKHYPVSMLWARAVTGLCHVLFSDIVHGFAYEAEEPSGGAVEAVWGAPLADPVTGEVVEDAPGPEPATTTPAGPGAASMRQAQQEATRQRQHLDTATPPQWSRMSDVLAQLRLSTTDAAQRLAGTPYGGLGSVELMRLDGAALAAAARLLQQSAVGDVPAPPVPPRGGPAADVQSPPEPPHPSDLSGQAPTAGDAATGEGRAS